MVEIETTEQYVKWLNKLRDEYAKEVINSRIAKLRIDEHFGKYKSVGHSVFELKIYYGPGYRVYFTKKGKRLILLLCGGDKSSQEHDIKKAHKMTKEI